MPVLTAAIITAAGVPLLLGTGAADWTSYTVRDGDTVWDIAKAHRTDVRTLVRANHLSDGGHRIRAGAALRIPAPAGQHATAGERASTSAAAGARTGRYRVHSGDTISGIALRLHVSPGTLLRLNHLDSRGRIYAGQHLAVPAARARAQVKATRSAAAGTRTTAYTVRQGDTVGAIAVRLGTTQAQILKANRLRPASPIFPGQRLRVAVAAPRFSATTFEGRTYPGPVLAAAAHNRRALAGRSVPGPEATRRMITRAAQRYGVDPGLALAVAYQESGWNQRQVSVANAVGVMQVVPASGRWASDLVGRDLDLLSTQDNVTAGVVILKALTRSAPDLEHAVAGYYQGLSSVRKHGMYADTERYVRRIAGLRVRFS